MKSLIENIKEAKKLSEGAIKIPIHYLIFIFTLLLVWQPDYVNLIAASSWVPENIKKILLNIVNLIYHNIVPIILVLVIIFIVLSILTFFTNIFDKIFPKDVTYTDNTQVSWNEYSAMNKIIRFFVNIMTVFWIYYFLINILFNPNNYVENFFKHESDLLENELITTGYMTNNDLELMKLLFWLNVIIAVFLVVRSLFEIRIPIDKYFIESDNIKFYIRLNSFQQKKSDGEESEVVILKDKYNNKPYFYLVNVQLSRQEMSVINDENKMLNRTLPYNKRTYKVINYSRNLDEIIYHFDFLKDSKDVMYY